MTGLVQFAREHLGLELWPGQVDVLQRWEASGRRRAVLRLGRRSGKDLMAAVAAIKNATVDDHAGCLRPGEQRFILVVATREQQGRQLVRVVRELLAAAPDPDLAALVDVGASTSDDVVFRTGVTLRAMPCSSRSTRGMAASLVVFNEAAHMMTEGDGFAAFQSVWRALVPSTAQFGARGNVMVLSTPLWPSGWFHTLCQAGEVGADPDLFHVHRPSWAMNPGITRASLDAEYVADPDGAAREYGAEFVRGAGAFLDPVEVHACKRRGGTRPPADGVAYRAAIDPSGGGGDAWTLGIAHSDGARGVVVDGVWAWHRAGFERTLDELVEVARRYRVGTLRTDQYSAQAVVEGLRRRGMACEAVPWTAANKEGVDLSGADLRGVSFRATKLAGADLSGATLWYADLGAADLDDAKFVGADLRHVQMNDGTSMKRTDFSDAYIVELYLDGATLDEAITTGADISGVRNKPPRPPSPPAPLFMVPVHHPMPTREQLLEAIAKVKEAEMSVQSPPQGSGGSDGAG